MSKTTEFLLLHRSLEASPPPVGAPSQVELCPLVAADAVAIHRLLQAAYASGYGSVPADALNWWEGIVTDSEFDPRLGFVAKAGNRIVGFCLVWTSSFIKDLVVDEQFRGRGLGSYLLRSAISEMRERGATGISLKVDVRNKAAQSLYRQFGFETVTQ